MGNHALSDHSPVDDLPQRNAERLAQGLPLLVHARSVTDLERELQRRRGLCTQLAAEAAALRLELQAMRHDRDQARAEGGHLADALRHLLAQPTTLADRDVAAVLLAAYRATPRPA